MNEILRGTLTQRADYTQKGNSFLGRHGWLRLTPAYSVKVVDEIIGGSSNCLRVFDPFCGTATTALSAASQGLSAVTTDINPFLIWLGRAKTAIYSESEIIAAAEIGREAIQEVRQGVQPASPPPIHNIERWWGQEALTFLCALRGQLDVVLKAEGIRDLLEVAFCRTVIATSNAAFNHQSMSFKENRGLGLFEDYGQIYLRDLDAVLRGAAINPSGDAKVLLADARALSKMGEAKFDLLVTSPPYANRMSYVRELRPYMYWLRFLTNGRDAGDLDWQAIGGTWGIATSRLQTWSPAEEGWKNNILSDVVAQVLDGGNKSGALLSAYIGKYFEDIWSHMCQLPGLMSSGSEVHYIVGNSTFYGVLLPVERLYAEMLSQLGFHDVKCRPIRKRNSKKELIEFDVEARWR